MNTGPRSASARTTTSTSCSTAPRRRRSRRSRIPRSSVGSPSSRSSTITSTRRRSWRRRVSDERQLLQQHPRRLIEVDLPLRKISEHARREKSIRHGHISTLHIWWARRPLAACRAVLCAALWPDPEDARCPEHFIAVAGNALLTLSQRLNGGGEDKPAIEL